MDDCLTPVLVDGILVPCGKCRSCRNNRKLDILSFLQNYDANCAFVTLTYDNDSVPYALDAGCTYYYRGVNKMTSDNIYSANLGKNKYFHTYGLTCLPDDVKDFVKRLRYYLAVNFSDEICKSFKYFISSEYGKKNTERPHYHCQFYFSRDACPWQMEGDSGWNCFLCCITKAWPYDNSYGITNRSSVAGKFCSKYVTKYITKFNHNKLVPFPEFQLWSNGFRRSSRENRFFDMVFQSDGEFSYVFRNQQTFSVNSPKTLCSIFHKPFRNDTSSFATVLQRLASASRHSDDLSFLRSYRKSFIYHQKPLFEYFRVLQKFYYKKKMFSLQLQYQNNSWKDYHTSVVESLRKDEKTHSRSGSLEFCRYFGISLAEFDNYVSERNSRFSGLYRHVMNKQKVYTFAK